ncbi:DUF349 domain-containing protein [Haliangium sp.]|uniref:DUF349 domain-containing protein n=1 Tax=Haliangium sp. TaxID=2663208 RepID=UPI003D0B8F56
MRADAVREMSADEVELVARIAREDGDPSVRRIAIDKLEDAALLAELSAGESDAEVRDRARSRAAELWVAEAGAAPDLAAARAAMDGLVRMGDQRALVELVARAGDAEVRDAALAALDEPRALAELARHGGAPITARRAAVERIDDVEVLRSVAVDEQRKELALAAVERITADEALEAVAAKAKLKAARSRARKKLADNAPAEPVAVEAPSAEDAEDKRRHAEQVQLLGRAEKLAKGSEWTRSAEEMDEIERRWAELGAAEADANTRFERARERYHSRRAAAERRRGDGGKRSAPAESDARPAETAPTAAAEPASAPAGDAAEQAASAPAPDGEAAAAAKSEAPTGDDAASTEAGAEASDTDRKQREEQALEGLEQLIQELERLGAGGKRRALERAVQRIEKAFDALNLPARHRAALERYKEAHQAAVVRVRELREAEEWERWANVPRQEALIASAEALLTTEDTARLGERLKTLQAEWRQVGPVPQKKSRELWDKFKSTCDQVYERVKESRARAAQEMQENLVRKEALCEEAEALAESTDWEETAEQIKQLQRTWRDIGPVPRKRSDAVWKRFRAACDRFFERRKPHLDEMLAERTAHLEQKLALCEEAEALAESSDWKETAAELRELQKAWREIGPVPRKDAGTVNKRFRAACDRFFQRRDQQREEERLARIRAAQELRDELQAILDGRPRPSAAAPSPAEADDSAAADNATEAGEAAAAASTAGAAADSGDGAAAESVAAESGDGAAPESDGEALTPAQRVLDVRSRLRDLTLSPSEQDQLYDLANRAAAKLLANDPVSFEGSELDPATSRQRKEKLCARMEELAPAPQTPVSTAGAQTAEQMAERLRAALAANALASSLAASTDGQHMAETITELERGWRRLGPVPGADGEALDARFHAAGERARSLIGK